MAQAPNDPAYFNPSINNPDKDALSYSKRIEAPDAQRFSSGASVARGIEAQRLSNAGDLFAATVRTTDNVIKRGIDEQTRDIVDENSDIALADQLDIPRDLTKSMDRLEARKSSKAAGKMTESYYRGVLDLEARRLKETFPGHKDYIEERLAQLTSQSTANKYRAALQAEANAASENDPQKQVAQAMKTDGQYIPDNMIKAYENGEQIDPRKLFSAIANGKKTEFARNQQLNEIKLKEEQGKNVKEDVKLRFGSELTSLAQKHLDTDWEKIRTGIIAAQNGNFNAAATKEIAANIQAAKLNFQAQVLEVQTGARGGYNYSTTLDATEIKAKVQPYLDHLDMLASAVGNPDQLGLLNVGTAAIKATTSSDGAALVDGSEKIRKLNAVNDRFGSTGMLLVMSGPGGEQMLNEAQQDIKNTVFTDMAVEDKTFDQVLSNQASTGKKMDGTTAQSTVDGIVIGITNPKVLPAGRKKVFDALVNSNTEVVLDPKVGFDNTTINGTAANVQFFRKATNPDIVKAAVEFDKTDPTALQRYEKFTVSGTKVLFGQVLASAQEIQLDPRASVTWNERTKQFEYSSSHYLDSITGVGAEQANVITQLNQAIKPLVNLYEAKGEDVTAALARDLPRLGFDGNAAKQTPWADKAIQGLWDNLRNNQPKVWSKLGATSGEGGVPYGFQISAMQGTQDQLDEINYALSQKPGDEALLKEKADLESVMKQLETQPDANIPARIMNPGNTPAPQPADRPSMMGYKPTDRQSTNVIDKSGETDWVAKVSVWLWDNLGPTADDYEMSPEGLRRAADAIEARKKEQK